MKSLIVCCLIYRILSFDVKLRHIITQKAELGDYILYNDTLVLPDNAEIEMDKRLLRIENLVQIKKLMNYIKHASNLKGNNYDEIQPQKQEDLSYFSSMRTKMYKSLNKIKKYTTDPLMKLIESKHTIDKNFTNFQGQQNISNLRNKLDLISANIMSIDNNNTHNKSN